MKKLEEGGITILEGVINKGKYIAFDSKNNVVKMEPTYDLARIEARAFGVQSPFVMHYNHFIHIHS